MGKKKNITTQENTYGHVDTPITPQIKALEAMKAKTDSSIPFNFSARRENLDNSYRNPLGSYTSPAVREAMQRNAGAGLAMQEAQAVQNSQYAADNTNFDRQALLAQMTTPKFVQTGGTSTQTQSGGLLGDLLTAGIGATGTAAGGFLG